MVGGVGGHLLLDMHLGDVLDGVLEGILDNGDGGNSVDGMGVVDDRGGDLNLGQLDSLDLNLGGGGNSHTMEASTVDSGTIDSGTINSGTIDSGNRSSEMVVHGVGGRGAQGSSDNSGENGKGLHVGLLVRQLVSH